MTAKLQPKPLIADEAAECIALMQWRDIIGVHRHPELALLYHIPNGGYRPKWTAYQLKRQGVKAAMPDYALPVARGGYQHLYLEMKRRDGGYVDPEQKAVHAALRGEGNRVEVCLGWEHAVSVLTEYLGGIRATPRGCARFHSPYALDD